MAAKEYENYEYNFARKQKQDFEKRLKIASIAFAVLLLLFACWSFFSSLDLFSGTTTQITQPISDPNSGEEDRIEANRAQIDAYASVRIPYRDPSDRFSIDFSTPYISSKIVVYINKADERDKIMAEANDIIATAQKSISITSVMYVNNY